jgi:transposase InsO family protein
MACGRDRVERLMKALDIAGARRGKKTKTTRRDGAAPSLPDLVNRSFVADRPNQLWVADITYVHTYIGFVYVAFVIDVFSRRIVGWARATHLRTELPLAALEMAGFLRVTGDGLVHHSDRGSPVHLHPLHRAPRRARGQTSVGSRGDSYDNALAESVVGLYKTELVNACSWVGRVHLEREPAALRRLVQLPPPPRRVQRQPAGGLRGDLLSQPRHLGHARVPNEPSLRQTQHGSYY